MLDYPDYLYTYIHNIMIKINADDDDDYNKQYLFIELLADCYIFGLFNSNVFT